MLTDIFSTRGLAAAILAIIASLGVSTPAMSQPGAVTSGLTNTGCEAIASEDFLKVEDAPATIFSAQTISGVDGSPSYCEVVGYAWRNVQFRVRLPAAGWNGKLVVLGTGGQAGSFMPDDPASPTSSSGQALRQGYATATHNGGHISSFTDALWAYNNDSALLDYAYRAPHVAGLIARAVVRHAYGSAPRRVYFSGCSNGGREALQMAQKYPYDYDGIIAGAPSLRWSSLFFQLYWLNNRTYGPNASLDEAALSTLHNFVIENCDNLDGKKDGILDDPRRCKVPLEIITCKPGENANCLSASQAKAAAEIYDGPRDRQGKSIAPSSAMPGSELTWRNYAIAASYPQSVFRFLTFTPAVGPAFVPDEALLGDYAKRTGGSDGVLSADNPDLRKFRDNGGKLLSYMGWNDVIGGVRDTLDYHATVERLMGGPQATLDFYRLFMVPGMNHCSGGGLEVDWLSTLDAWVDKGKQPDRISGPQADPVGTSTVIRTVTPISHD